LHVCDGGWTAAYNPLLLYVKKKCQEVTAAHADAGLNPHNKG